MENEKNKKNSNLPEENTNKSSKISKLDLTLIFALVIIYSALAFFNLGSTKVPQTYYHFLNNGESVGLELTNGSQRVSKIRYYNGPEVGNYTIMVSEDGTEYTNLMELEPNSVFAWEEITIDSEFKYITFLSGISGGYLGDVQLYDSYGEKIAVKSTSDEGNVLIDELDRVPATISHLNSTYFDEIYFARSAYEYTQGLNTYEWTHPPLGKLIMALPILLFGFSPFTFRLMGTIAGILMIPVIYILAKRLFKNTKWAVLAGLLMAFDNFHFAHTRMATVDSFLVLFILLSCLFMKQYLDLDKEAEFKHKARNLILSGLFIGCAIATKWTGLYALLGLAILFFSHLFKQYEDGRRKKFNYNRASKIALAGIVAFSLAPTILYYFGQAFTSKANATTMVFWYLFFAIFITMLSLVIILAKKDASLKKLFIVCTIAFVLIPVVIYVLSYILFPNVTLYTGGISGIFNQMGEMYKYHSTLSEGHAFQSKWFEWPIMYKPVWYYVGYYGGNIKATIVGIGNPLIWWVGIPAAIFTFIAAMIKRKQSTFFISILILSTFVPYIFIGRVMFMYHFFPTLPFIMLAIVAFIKFITEKIKNNSVYIFYSALVIVMFLIFYPVTSGMLTTTDYIDSLKWLSSWIF